jgi:RND superfamily putative drug exporter
MKPLARFSTRRPLLILLAWIGVAVGLQLASTAAGPDMRDTYSLPGTDSQAAYDLMGERFPSASGDTDTIAFKVSAGTVTDPAAAAAIADVLSGVADVASVAGITSPLTLEGAGQISQDGTIAYATVTYNELAYNIPIADIQQVGDIASAANGQAAGDATLTVGHAGQAASRLANPTVGVGEGIGLLIAAVILFFAFGSLLATTVPLISAIVALTASLGALTLASNLSPIATSAPTLSVLLGLGIGIDYALFIVNRYRRELKAGTGVRDAVIRATATSGRAVVFAGITVFIALAGMFVPQITFLSNLATAAAITVVFSVAASVTLVPALLMMYGSRVLSRREHAALTADAEASSAHAEPGAVANFVERHPLVTSVAAVGVLAFLAAPALDLRLGNADQGNDPVGTPTRIAYDLIADGFGDGANGPLVIAVDLDEAGPFDAAAPPAGVALLLANLSSDPEVAAVMGPQPSADGSAVLITVVPTGSPQDEATADLLTRVRGDYAAQAQAEGLVVNVGGTVASNADFTDAISDSLPLFFVIVVGLSVLVLTVAFRSVVLPLVGAAMNLLSAGAAFGIVVAVFQHGFGASLIGIGEGGPIEPFAPLILFALLFGLSMDYQVFLVSRVAEIYHATGDNRLAVRRGLAEVSRVILAAASIMVVVFGSFVTSDARVMKLLGLGLAAAIFVDAFVIRVVLMPAVMRLLGRANWYLPGWLDRVLPHLEIDGDVSAEREEASGEERELEPALGG